MVDPESPNRSESDKILIENEHEIMFKGISADPSENNDIHFNEIYNPEAGDLASSDRFGNQIMSLNIPGIDLGREENNFLSPGSKKYSNQAGNSRN
jgi:hypothetical protein